MKLVGLSRASLGKNNFDHTPDETQVLTAPSNAKLGKLNASKSSVIRQSDTSQKSNLNATNDATIDLDENEDKYDFN